MSVMLQYQISPISPNHHLFSVTLTFDSAAQQCYTLSLPAWLPGSYMIRDFTKNILEIKAFDSNDNVLELGQVDKQTWTVIANDSQVKISYQVFAFDLSVRTAYLDSQRGFFNGSSTFLEVRELANSPCQLEIQASLLPEHSEWLLCYYVGHPFVLLCWTPIRKIAGIVLLK